MMNKSCKNNKKSQKNHKFADIFSKISVFFDKEEATKLVKNIINEIKEYKYNTKSYENEISISDDMVYKERR